MVKLLKITLRSLTPLWTGDVDRDSPTLRETGIIGSLRWWYEGLWRAMGIPVCTPIEGRGCQFDAEAYQRASHLGEEEAIRAGLREVCPPCRLFGCTGWARRFRVSASPLKTLPLFFVSHRRMANLTGNWLIRVYDGHKRTFSDSQGRRRYVFSFENTVLWSTEFSLCFAMLHPQWEDDACLLAYLIHLISTYGALGAKVQNGFGQVKVIGWEGWPERAIERGREQIQNMGRGSPKEGEAFDLYYFFSRTYSLPNISPYDCEGVLIGEPPSGFDYSRYFIPCAFDIRYKSSSKHPITGQGVNFGMRPYFHRRFGQYVTNKLLGESQPRKDEDRAASRINVSHLYRDAGRWKLKVWGHVPPGLKDRQGQAVGVVEVVKAVDDFITGPRGMFPGSRVLVEECFDRRKELGR